MKQVPKMNVGDKVRCIDGRLGMFFKKGEIYTVETSEPMFKNEKGEDVTVFTFVEVPGYMWTCSFLFEDITK